MARMNDEEGVLAITSDKLDARESGDQSLSAIEKDHLLHLTGSRNTMSRNHKYLRLPEMKNEV